MSLVRYLYLVICLFYLFFYLLYILIFHFIIIYLPFIDIIFIAMSILVGFTIYTHFIFCLYCTVCIYAYGFITTISHIHSFSPLLIWIIFIIPRPFWIFALSNPFETVFKLYFSRANGLPKTASLSFQYRGKGGVHPTFPGLTLVRLHWVVIVVVKCCVFWWMVSTVRNWRESSPQWRNVWMLFGDRAQNSSGLKRVTRIQTSSIIWQIVGESSMWFTMSKSMV